MSSGLSKGDINFQILWLYINTGKVGSAASGRSMSDKQVPVIGTDSTLGAGLHEKAKGDMVDLGRALISSATGVIIVLYRGVIRRVFICKVLISVPGPHRHY